MFHSHNHIRGTAHRDFTLDDPVDPIDPAGHGWTEQVSREGKWPVAARLAIMFVPCVLFWALVGYGIHALLTP